MGVIGPRAAILTRPETPRPHGPVPRDEAHEWLKRPLPAEHPVLDSWERHFRAHGVPYATRAYPDGRVMLYVHRFVTPATERHAPRWCCS